MNNELYLRIRDTVTNDDLSSMDKFSNFLERNSFKLTESDWSKSILYDELKDYLQVDKIYQECHSFFLEYQNILIELKERLLNQTIDKNSLIEIESKNNAIENFIKKNDIEIIDNHLNIKGPTNPLLPNKDYQRLVHLSDDFHEFTEQYSLFNIYFSFFKDSINQNEKIFDNLLIQCNKYLEDLLDSLELQEVSIELKYNFYNHEKLDEAYNKFFPEMEKNNNQIDEINNLQSNFNIFLSMIETFYNSNKELVKILKETVDKPLDIKNLYSFIARDYYFATKEEKLKAFIFIGYGLIQRLLPIIDLIYITTQNQEELSNIINYDELDEIRDSFIEILTKGRFSSYERNNEARKLTKQIFDFTANTKETITIILLSSILKNDIESVLNTKQQLKSYFSTANEEQLDSIVNSIVQNLENKIVQKPEFNSIEQELINTFSSYKIVNDNIKELKDSFFRALTTGEYLYKLYMTDEKKSMDFDYSFISIMYYTALENLLNSLFYNPYALNIKSNKEIYTNKVSNYLSIDEKNRTKFFYKDFSMGRFVLKQNVEMGTLAYLMKQIPYIANLNKYIQNNYNLKSFEIKKLSELGKEIQKASDKRNKAAHGADRLSAEDARIDKSLVFNKAMANLYKGLIIDFIQIFGESK